MVDSPVRYRRHSEGIEFERLIFFTDAVFAIAITLLVVEVGIPAAIPDSDSARDLWDAVWEKLPVIAAFFLGCFVIGGYWLVNHRFVSNLTAVDRRYAFYTVLYVALVAFLPFPIGVLGEFPRNPFSVVVLAVSLGCVSTMEAVLFGHAWRARLFREDVPRDVYRWSLLMSLSPVALFALSVPVAFVDPWAGVAVWALAVPVQAWLERRRPPATSRYFA